MRKIIFLAFALALGVLRADAATTSTYIYKDAATPQNIFSIQLFQCASGPIFCTAMVFQNSSGVELMTTTNPGIFDTGSNGNLINAVKALPLLTSGTPGIVDTNATGNLINAIKAPPAPTLGTSGGWTPFPKVGLSTAVTAVKASAGQLGFAQCDNVNGVFEYVQIFNATTGNVTLGSTAPTQILPIPPGLSNGFVMGTVGMQYSTAISIAATTTASGSTAPSIGLNCTFGFN